MLQPRSQVLRHAQRHPKHLDGGSALAGPPHWPQQGGSCRGHLFPCPAVVGVTLPLLLVLMANPKASDRFRVPGFLETRPAEWPRVLFLFGFEWNSPTEWIPKQLSSGRWLGRPLCNLVVALAEARQKIPMSAPGPNWAVLFRFERLRWASVAWSPGTVLAMPPSPAWPQVGVPLVVAHAKCVVPREMEGL